MKIAFVQQPISPVSTKSQEGSLEIWIYEMARRMAKHHDVVVYAKKVKPDKEFELHEGVKYRRIKPNIVDECFARNSGQIDRLFWSVFLKSKRPLFVSHLYYFIYALHVAKFLKYEKCDVVHLHNFPQFIPIIRAFNPKIKIVLEMHCEWLAQLNRKIIESRLKKTDLIVGVSEYITDEIRRRFPKFAPRCKTLINGVDIGFFANDNRHHNSDKENVKQLLFVGRVSPEKGVHVLLDAFQMVFECYPRVHLTIVGSEASLPVEFLVELNEDPLTKELERFYDVNYMSYLESKFSPELASHVTFTGSIPHRLLKDYYRTADVVVLPSVCNEPCALPLFEAMAASVPVVASRGGGTPEVIVDGKTGLLVERGDASALAEAVLSLISNDALNKSMGEAGRKRAVELFSWEQTTQNLCELYENIYPGDA
jgi:glycosyltransferase involved in cell wall biosynthesis